MTPPTAPLLALGDAAANTDTDNVTDWCLEQFQAHYDNRAITKDAIWEYLYGVMHAPDWRERYAHDLRRNLPRIPLADDFEAFRSAGRQLLHLHGNYDSVVEWPVECRVDGWVVDGAGDPDAFRIQNKMRWGGTQGNPDHSVLRINDRCELVGIPEEAHGYTVSGRSPLEWAIQSLRHKYDRKAGIADDPNGWRDWADQPFELVRHLRRLVRVSVETTCIVNSLPPSLSD